LEDEAIRAFFSLVHDRSEAGGRIWDERVIGSSIVRSPSFCEYLVARVQDFAVATPSGVEILPAFDVPIERVEPFMVRLTKGLLRFHYPEYDYRDSRFDVRFLPSTEETLQALEQGLVGTMYEERGEGVIRYRHGITDTGLNGIWFFMFYDAVWLLVHHTRDVRPQE
jgi:hypothetical protein